MKLLHIRSRHSSGAIRSSLLPPLLDHTTASTLTLVLALLGIVTLAAAAGLRLPISKRHLLYLSER